MKCATSSARNYSIRQSGDYACALQSTHPITIHPITKSSNELSSYTYRQYQMKKLVVLSGAGISAESGIPTFRDADGLWEGYDVMEVATPDGWRKNPALVLDFYNQRR